MLSYFYCDCNIFQSEYCQMDYPRDNYPKKKNSLVTQGNYTKPTIAFMNSQMTSASNKGKIKIEQYQYDEENILGQGYSSRVYLGRLTQNPRKQFAIKVIDKRRLGKNKDNLQLLKEEINIHKQLDHPNIVKCFEIFEKGNNYYFILQHCPHGTLDGFIKKHQKLNQSVAIGILEQIMAGYKYLLQLKVIHRDLKPPNILKSGPNWKICDFGFSLIGKTKFAGDLNVGTPAYMAPESLERTFYSPKTDFFSIGIICYEMLFGVTPWQHKNQKILLQLMKEKKLEQESLNGLKNQNLVDFIMTCCEANERKRIKPQEFQEYNFWKQNEVRERKVVEQTQPLSKTLFVKDTWSTNPSQVSNTTSSMRSGSRSDKYISNQECFKGNSSVIQHELYYATLIQNIARHHAYFLFEQANEKEIFLTILIKHQGYIIRRLKLEKMNYLHLKKWKQYSESKQYAALKRSICKLQSEMKELANAQIKRKTITTIRFVNKRFDSLTFEQQLSSVCMNNLKDYLMDLMQKTVEKYEAVGKKYIKENSWTTQVVECLLHYYRYVGDALKSTQESRLCAIKGEDGQRAQLLQEFKRSTKRFGDFQSLKEQIAALQN